MVHPRARARMRAAHAPVERARMRAAHAPVELEGPLEVAPPGREVGLDHEVRFEGLVQIEASRPLQAQSRLDLAPELQGGVRQGDAQEAGLGKGAERVLQARVHRPASPTR